MTFALPEPPPLDPSRDALFLDFDGTLVPLAATPDGVNVTPALVEMLHGLDAMLSGRLALVSGRAIAVLQDLGLHGLTLAGSHGAEWQLAGQARVALPRALALDAARDAFAAFAATRDGVLFEDKPLGAALHYRLAPAHEAASVALARELAADLHVQHGHAMIELRVPGVDKGTAIARLMGDAPFAGHRPVFAGDDMTDEDGFAATIAMGGHGILVGPARDSHAAFNLPDPASVLTWLAAVPQQAR